MVAVNAINFIAMLKVQLITSRSDFQAHFHSKGALYGNQSVSVYTLINARLAVIPVFYLLGLSYEIEQIS